MHESHQRPLRDRIPGGLSRGRGASADLHPRVRSQALRSWWLLPIAALTAWAYAPALHGSWLWDDALSISDNPLLRTARGLGELWRGRGTPDYFPLSGTVAWVEWHLFGQSTTGYHLVALALHGSAALGLTALLRRLGVRSAWIAGALFALHPLAVESAAWIAELKNVLSACLLFPAALAYLTSADLPAGRRRTAAFASALVLFLASALAKSSVATAPCALALLTWWRKGRLSRRDWAALAPFFVISLAVGTATMVLQQHRDMEGGVLPLGGPLSRLAVAGLTASFYLGKFLAPVGLSPVYVRWAVDPPSARQLLPAVLILALLVCSWLKRATWGRPIFAGAGSYLALLLPVAGFVPAAYFHISWVADHFAYLPLAVLCACAAAAADRWIGRAESRLPLGATVAASFVIAALALASHTHAAAFRDEEALWLRAEAISPGCWTVDNNLGKVLLKMKRPEDALARLRAARHEAPRYAWPEIDLHLGMALGFSGRPFEGIAVLREAVALKPDFAGARNNLGLLLSRSGQGDEAITQFELAARQDPRDPEIWNNLGTVLTDAGRFPEAVQRFEAALRLDPEDDDARRNLGGALGREGRFGEAEVELRRVLAKQPGRADTHNDLGIVLVRLGRLSEAEAEFQQAVKLDPSLRQGWQNLARVKRDLGR